MIPVSRNPAYASDHHHLEQKLGRIAERIRDQGEKRRLLARILNQVKDDFRIPLDEENHGAIESELVQEVDRASLDDLVIAGVDGGVLNKPLHGLDLILLRSVVAVFSYEGDELQEVDYHPGEMPVPRLINIHEPMDSRELDTLVGLHRQLSEIERAGEIVRKRDIDALLLDGSVTPQYVNHFSKNRTKEVYKRLTDSFTSLYRTCADEGVLLMGAVKDSRSARMAGIFQKELFPELLKNSELSEGDISSLKDNRGILENSRDTAFLDHLLEAGERTFTFKYAKSPGRVLEDLGGWKDNIYAFYVKPVPYDRPVRVEVVSGSDAPLDTVERAAPLVNTLAGGHEACALPSVLIEADARAALEKEEISILRDNIADRLEPSSMLDLRRERRPF